MADRIGVLAALTDEREKSIIRRVLTAEDGDYDVHFPDSIASIDTLLGSHDIDIILLDYEFQNGALADWLSLWPLPYIVFTGTDQIDRLKDILEEESSLFIIREPSYQYIHTLPIVIDKVLATRELQSIQNRFLQISERRYIKLVQALPDIIYHIDENGNFLYINDSVKSLGYDPLELIGRHFSTILDPGEVKRVSKREVLKEYLGKATGDEDAPKLFDERRSGERKTKNLVVRLKPNRGHTAAGKMGSIISYGEVNSAGFLEVEAPGEVRGTVGIIRDVTEKISHERLLEESVEEKTILLKEIHHRVKNNLQIILSLINIHSSQELTDEHLPILSEIQSEIHSMALVHDQLCRSDSVGRIDMQEYFVSLLDKLFDMYGVDLRRIGRKVSAEGVLLRIESATPVGLIVTELVSNSLKYAFPGEADGLVEVSFSPGEEGFYNLTVRDTGRGFSLDDTLESLSIGLQLVDVLADQLRGTVRFETDHGTRVTLSLPEKMVASGR